MTFARSVLAALLLVAHAQGAGAQDVTFNLNQSMTVQEAEVDYTLDLTLRAVGPTRLGVDALLDLRDFQSKFTRRVAGNPILDVCGNQTLIDEVSVDAQGRVIAVVGELEATFFVCNRTGGPSFERGEVREKISVGFSGAFSARVEGDCVVFEIDDVTLSPLQQFTDPEEGERNLARAKTLMLEAVGLILDESPFCPDFPEELASLDPMYDIGEPREIGDGGLGVILRGSVDTSTSTLLDVLDVLQGRGVLPGRP